MAKAEQFFQRYLGILRDIDANSVTTTGEQVGGSRGETSPAL